MAFLHSVELCQMVFGHYAAKGVQHFEIHNTSVIEEAVFFCILALMGVCIIGNWCLGLISMFSWIGCVW